MSRLRHDHPADDSLWDDQIRAQLAAVEPPPGAKARLTAALDEASEISATRTRRGFLWGAAASAAAIALAAWPRAKRWSLSELLDLAGEVALLLENPDVAWDAPGPLDTAFPSRAITVTPQAKTSLDSSFGVAEVVRLNMPSDLRRLASAAVVTVSGAAGELPPMPPRVPQRRSGAFVASAWTSDQLCHVLVIVGPAPAYDRLARVGDSATS